MMFHPSSRRTLAFMLIVVVLLLLIGFGMLMNNNDNISTENVTLEGEFVCLPHKNTGGAQTRECAFGLRDEKGDHYALDLRQMQGELEPGWDTGSLTVRGTLIPVEQSDNKRWEIYDIKGVMNVRTIEIKES